MEQSNSPTSRLSRRQFLGAGVATATAAVAGCTEGTINWIADKFLEEVNIFNDTDSEVSGAVTVVGPEGGTRLDEEFTLSSTSSDSDNEGNGVFHGGVWTDAGSYDVSIELDDPVDGETSAAETVSINDPDDEMLVVVLGGKELDEAIAFRVGDNLSDTWPEGTDE
jgi:hypothetical protein